MKEFFSKHNLTFSALLDRNGKVSELYQAWALPVSVVINKRGEIRLNIQDILNRTAYFYHDVDKSKVLKLETRTDLRPARCNWSLKRAGVYRSLW